MGNRFAVRRGLHAGWTAGSSSSPCLERGAASFTGGAAQLSPGAGVRLCPPAMLQGVPGRLATPRDLPAGKTP